jgi:hypothetical protein
MSGETTFIVDSVFRTKVCEASVERLVGYTHAGLPYETDMFVCSSCRKVTEAPTCRCLFVHYSFTRRPIGYHNCTTCTLAGISANCRTCIENGTHQICNDCIFMKGTMRSHLSDMSPILDECRALPTGVQLLIGSYLSERPHQLLGLLKSTAPVSTPVGAGAGTLPLLHPLPTFRFVVDAVAPTSVARKRGTKRTVIKTRRR